MPQFKLGDIVARNAVTPSFEITFEETRHTRRIPESELALVIQSGGVDEDVLLLHPDGLTSLWTHRAWAWRKARLSSEKRKLITVKLRLAQATGVKFDADA